MLKAFLRMTAWSDVGDHGRKGVTVVKVAAQRLGEGGERPPLGAVRQWQRPRRNRGRLDDGCRRLPMSLERVQHAVERSDALELKTHDETVFSGYPMAFDDAGRILRQLDDLLQLTRRRPDSHHDRHRIAEEFRIEIEPDSADEAGILEALDAFADGRARHADGPRNVCVRNARVFNEGSQNLHIDRVSEKRRTL
jgi:hypothetical protein